jgi:8-oxo-dGTP pyrophosphatase MutT (NUDIX family)
MSIKVYFNEKTLYLTDGSDEEITAIRQQDNVVFQDEFSPEAVELMLHELRRPAVRAAIFQHADLDALRQAFWQHFTLVKAGGGLVLNENDEILMIFRRGRWDLPKGKLDEGESIEECAVREVKEETGLVDVRLKNPLLITYHVYRENDETILKESHWYRMKASGDTELIPQTEEQITDIRWASLEEAIELANNSFPSIKDVLQAFLHRSAV